MRTSAQIFDQLRAGGLVMNLEVKGQGAVGLATFPGIGMDSSFFATRLTALEDRYKLFHFSMICEKSVDSLNFSRDWNELLNVLTREYQIEEWNAVAFSIGARWLFYSRMTFDKVFLIAPDGVVDHWVFRNVVSNMFYQFLFEKFFRLGLFFFKENLGKYNLHSLSVVNQWKLLGHKKFSSFKMRRGFCFLASKDKFISSKKAFLVLDKHLFCEVSILECTHFKLPNLVRIFTLEYFQ